MRPDHSPRWMTFLSRRTGGGLLKLLLTGALAAALPPLTAGAPGGEKGEPRHEGKTLSEWLQDLKEGNLEQKRAAALALGKLGPAAKAAVPELRRALRSRDEELRRNAAVAFISLKAAGEP